MGQGPQIAGMKSGAGAHANEPTKKTGAILKRRWQGDRRRAAEAVIALALATLTIAIVLMIAGSSRKPACVTVSAECPSASPGFQQALLWFELMRSRDEVQPILGDPATAAGQDLRAAMNRVNYIDYVFMIAYPALNLALLVYVGFLCKEAGFRRFGPRLFAALGGALALSMFIGDALENLALLRIAAAPVIADIPERVIRSLQLWTDVKWTALFIACFLLGAGYLASGLKGARYLLAACALIPFSAGALGLMGLHFTVLPDRDYRFLVEHAAAVMALAWIVGLVDAIFEVRAARRAAKAAGST